MKGNEDVLKISEKLQKDFERWDALYTFGGQDPFWSDGCNLKFVRNHIMYHKGELEKLIVDGEYPQIYHRETPQEVPRDYMARSEEIRANALKSVKLYNADENYHFLLSQIDKLNPKDAEKTCIQNVIGYVVGLEQAIAQDDLISMRRHENPERYIESFRDCAERVRALKPLKLIKNEQLSLFYLLEEGVENNAI
jgi:hypothetical protein